MTNTRNIQPFEIQTLNGAKIATIFSLTNFHGYNFDNSHAFATYKLIGMEIAGSTTDENGNVYDLPQSAIEYLQNEIVIPSAIISQWGASDDIVFNYVAEQLGLVIIQ